MRSKNYHHGDLKNALIQAGIEILSRQGLAGLSLRKVAEKAGVSHAAPYAHFPDKQSLIGAIATQGFRQLYGQLADAVLCNPNQPRQQLAAAAVTYARFALERTETFKLMFSSSLEKGTEVPELTEIIQTVTNFVRKLVDSCLEGGEFKSDSPELTGVIIWGQVHGIVLLYLENQIPSGVLQSYSLIQLVEIAVAGASAGVRQAEE